MPAPAIELHLDREGNGHIIVGDIKVPADHPWDSCEYAEEEIEKKFGHDTVRDVWKALSKARQAEYRLRLSTLKEEGFFQSDAVVDAVRTISWAGSSEEDLLLALEMRLRKPSSAEAHDKLLWLRNVRPHEDLSFEMPLVKEAEALFEEALASVPNPPKKNPYEGWRTRRASSFSLAWAPSYDLDDETFRLLVDALYELWDSAVENYFDHDEDERQAYRYDDLYVVNDLDLVTMKKCYTARDIGPDPIDPTAVFCVKFDLAKDMAYVFPQS